MGGTARSGSHLPEKSDCRIRQFARTVYDQLFSKLGPISPWHQKILTFGKPEIRNMLQMDW